MYEYLTGGGIDAQLGTAGHLADVSALIVEGRQMRDALVADLRRIEGVDVTYARSRLETVRLGYAHCMASRGESMEAFVARAARQHDYSWVIAPECDGLLLRFHDVVGAARWLGCGKEAIRVASSKRATAACLAAHGIAATPALDPGDTAAHDGERWVVKPDDGAGGLDTLVFDRFADACAEYDTRAADARNPVLQAWVDGEPLSLSLICGDDGAELVSINRQKISLSGESSDGLSDGPRDADPPRDTPRIVEFDGVQVGWIERSSERGRALDALAQRVAQAIPGLRGFVGIDVVWHPQRGPVVIEVNPRLTVAYAELAAARGSRITRALLASHGLNVEQSAASCSPTPLASRVRS